MEQRQEFLKQHLTDFVTQHSSEVSLCGIDEIVLSYMVSILEELGQENTPEDLFDVDEFTEMMEAYLPGFGHINSITVSEWMFDLASKIHNIDKLDSAHPKKPSTENSLLSWLSSPVPVPQDSRIPAHPQPHTLNNPFKDLLTRPLSVPNGDAAAPTRGQADTRTRTQSLGNVEPHSHRGQRSRTTSSSSGNTTDRPRTQSTSSGNTADRPRTQSTSSTTSSNDAASLVSLNGDLHYDDSSDGEEDKIVTLLREMFPTACTMEINHCLSVVHGNTEEAAQLILTRQECGESLVETSSKKKAKKPGSKKVSVSILDDRQMKKSIINKYSYVDVDAHKKDHKPLAPKKQQEKKMVRYLDSKIVTTRGERFTEIKKDDDEKMKKTYVNLKPAKQYRFH